MEDIVIKPQKEKKHETKAFIRQPGYQLKGDLKVFQLITFVIPRKMPQKHIEY